MTEAEHTERRGWDTYGGKATAQTEPVNHVAYETHNSAELWHGDALDLIPKLPEFTCIFTDPPYCSGGRQTNQARATVSKNRFVTSEDWIDGDNMGSQTYNKFLREFGALLKERAATSCELFIMTDWRQSSCVEEAMEFAGWRYSKMIVWAKLPGMGSRFQSSHELVLFFTNKGKGKHQTGTKNYWYGAKPRNKLHPNEKPIGLIKHCIMSQPGERRGGKQTGPGLVVDPFVGSGSTIIAAQQLGFPVIGIERNKVYLDMAKRRMRQEGHELGRLAI